MWVFIERVGDLYVGVAHDEGARLLVEVTEPIDYGEMHGRMKAVLTEVDCSDIDTALYDADQRPNDGRDPEREFLHLIHVRAGAGLASEADATYVIEQLTDPNSIHRTTFLLRTLGFMGSRYEHVIAPFLNHGNTDREAECAMDALFQMGLTDKYVDQFVGWMRGTGPSAPRMVGSMTYGMAAHAFRQSKNPKILQALIDASNDVAEKWTTRAHARSCLASAVDLENAPIGERLPWDDRYYLAVLEKAEVMLDELLPDVKGNEIEAR